MFDKNTHVLLARTDHIGDVILSLPLAGWLKKKFSCKITFLVSRYTRHVVEASPYVDHCIDLNDFSTFSSKVTYLKSLKVDVFVSLFPRHHLALLGFLSRIPKRLGTSRRWYHHIWCTDLVKLSRKKSQRHESLLNFFLIKPFVTDIPQSMQELLAYVRLDLQDELPTYLQEHFETSKFKLIIHPGTHGNAREWPEKFWIELVQALPKEVEVYVTGSPDEAKRFKKLGSLVSIHNLMGQTSLSELLLVIHQSDGLVANSTGPLHMAATMAKPCLGLFAPIKGMEPDRWGPLGPRAQWLMSDEICNTCTQPHCTCMQQIPPEKVLAQIHTWIAEIK